jgi:ATP-dependent DNA helicase RecG
MNESELKKLIASGETEAVEFKEISNEHFYKTISGMANTKGGAVLLGVNKKGSIVGIDSSSQFLEDMTNRIVNKLSVYPEIKTVDIKGKRVIGVKIGRSGFPVSYEGRYYERVGNTTREISPQKLRAFMLGNLPWDSITKDFSYDEIDIETGNLFVRLAVGKKRLADISLDESPKTVLEKLELISDGKLKNGAILIFGRNPQKHFINHCVRIGRFKTETTIIDDKWAKGNLFQQFEETINILKQFISVRYEIKDFQREDIWDYPIPALREAVLNALTHRDYFNIANFILIKVYDDHIWFSNPGGLPEGIAIEELKKPHGSFLRNPLIAKVFYLAGFIEQYGSGTVRMVEWMKEAGLPEPEYKEEMGGFSVYFYKDIYTEENLRKIGLNERQIKAVMYVKEKGRITNKEFQKIAGISKPTATRELTTLIKMNLLEQRGITGKGTFYQLRKGSQTAQTAHKGLTNDSN